MNRVMGEGSSYIRGKGTCLSLSQARGRSLGWQSLDLRAISLPPSPAQAGSLGDQPRWPIWKRRVLSAHYNRDCESWGL